MCITSFLFSFNIFQVLVHGHSAYYFYMHMLLNQCFAVPHGSDIYFTDSGLRHTLNFRMQLSKHFLLSYRKFKTHQIYIKYLPHANSILRQGESHLKNKDTAKASLLHYMAAYFITATWPIQASHASIFFFFLLHSLLCMH